jgi:hypothetical protein
MIALIVFGIALLFPIALSSFNSFALRAGQVKALNRAKQIGFACRSYAMDHGGNYPPSLKALVPDYIPSREDLRSPLNPSDPIGYVYTPGLKDDSPADAVLLVDKRQRIVIHVDDSAELENPPRDHW